MPIPQNNTPEPRLTARERVYQTLRDWITDGTMQPGEKISDIEIAKYFSVSRTPVREAIQLLADQKLIDIFPGKESRISEINIEKTKEYYEILAELHGTAARFAYPHITASHIRRLEEINEKIEAAFRKKNYRLAADLDVEFHKVFIDLADNDFLTSFINTLYVHVQRVEITYQTLFVAESRTVVEHQAIIDALKEGDQEKTIAAMKANWLSTPDLLKA